MSRHRNHTPINPTSATPSPPIPPAIAAKALMPDRPQPAIPKFRQCPICYQGYGGIGKSNGNYKGRRRYYRCDQCGFQWIYDIPTSEEVRPEHDLDIR